MIATLSRVKTNGETVFILTVEGGCEVQPDGQEVWIDGQEVRGITEANRYLAERRFVKETDWQVDENRRWQVTCEVIKRL